MREPKIHAVKSRAAAKKVRAVRPAPRLDADDAIIIAMAGLAIAIKRSVRELAETGSRKRKVEIAERLRILWRAELGIPEPSSKGYETVLVLNLEAWIQQARTEERDAFWLQQQCMAVDPRFGPVPAASFQAAIAPVKRRGPAATQLAAVELARAAGIKANVSAARNLKSRSKGLQP